MQEIKYYLETGERPAKWFAFLVFAAAITIAMNSVAGTQLMFLVALGTILCACLAGVLVLTLLYEGTEYTISDEKIRWVQKMRFSPLTGLFNATGDAYSSLQSWKGNSIMLEWVERLEYIPRNNSAKVVFTSKPGFKTQVYKWVPFPSGRGEEIFNELVERVKRAGGTV